MATREAAKPAHQVLSDVLGYVDRATVGEVHGWVWDRRDPLARRKVNLFVDGSLVGSFVACRFRQDLKDAHIGDGFYSFEIALPRGKYRPGSVARVVDAATGTELFNSPTRLAADQAARADVTQRAEAARAAPRPQPVDMPSSARDGGAVNVISLPSKSMAAAAASALVGEVLWADERSIVGWVADQADPERRLRVQALVDGRECGSALADGRVVGGRSGQIGDGMHGFRIDFRPEHLIAERMEVQVVVEGGLAVLRPAGGVIGTAIQGGLDRCDDRLVRGWAADWNDPARKLTVEIFVNDRLVGEAEANRPRDDLKRLGVADGACGFLFRFPKPIEMKLSQDVVVRVLVAHSHVELAHSPWWVGRAAALPRSTIAVKP